MANTSLLKVLNQEEVQKIHEGSVEILKETGIVFQSKEVLDIFKEHGAKVDGNKVYISEEIINESLSTTPENFKLWARDESKSIIIGKGSESLAIQPNIGPIYIQDIKHGKRDSTLKDLINIFKLCQESDIVNLIGATPVEPNDIKNDEKHLQIMYNLLKHTDKALASIARERKRIREMFDMIEIAVGDKKVLEDEYFILVGVCPASPLRFEKIPSETILEYAKRAQPIKIVPSIMSGVSGPIGLFGTAILQNAEMLAGLVLIQMINPGNPVIFMPGSTVADMRTGAYLTGSPEGTLINIGNI